MRKTFLILAVMALVCLPALSLAQTEFSLGGYIKLDSFWDSTSMNKNLTSPVLRTNNSIGNHGRFNATSQSSRFNFTIKGPKLWGATVTGMIEMDFDKDVDTRQNSGNSYTPRMRLAFFRFNWPGTELIMGQYWGLLSTFAPETIQDAGYQSHGFPATDRFAQIRLTQSFGLGWAKDDKMDLSLLVGKPIDSADSNVNPSYQGNTSGLSGQSTETPQIQGAITYEADLWGKAAFYGRPKGFTAQIAGGWQRTQYANSTTGVTPTSFVAYGIAKNSSGLDPDWVYQNNNQYLNNWVFQGSLFIPVIPTATKNLSGTMSLMINAYLGEGLEFIGNQTGQGSFLVACDPTRYAEVNDADRKLQQVWGGTVQMQYYFNNEWYLTWNMGTGQNYGVDRRYAYFTNDPVKGWWETNLALYLRPVQALKFGLGYSYSRTDYFMQRPAGAQSLVIRKDATGKEIGGAAERGDNYRTYGDNHRVEFGAWFYF